MGLFWLGHVTHRLRDDLGMCFFEAGPVIYQGGVMGRDIPKLFSFEGCVVCFMTGWSISWISLEPKDHHEAKEH